MPDIDIRTHTRTFAKVDIVLKPRNFGDMQPIVYVQDLSYKTITSLPKSVGAYINPEHVRVFEDMRKFTEWLVNYPAIVDSCWVIE